MITFFMARTIKNYDKYERQKASASKKLRNAVNKWNLANRQFNLEIQRWKAGKIKHIRQQKVLKVDRAKIQYEKAQKYYKKVVG